MPGWLRNGVGALILLATAAGTVVLHRALDRHQAEQISRVAEAESWAARSQLVRAIETRLRSYRDLARYWSAWGRLPRDQWETDAGIEVGHFPGVRMIVWYDPERDVRFYVTPDNFVPDYRPSDQEWNDARALLGSANDVGDEAMVGPAPGPDGHPHYRVYVRGATPGSMLAALIDAHDSLQHLLQDESAGYAVAVHWKDVELYRRDQPARDIPPSWTRSGVIETSMGARWRVTHAPGAELADSLHTPLGTAVLAGGLAISALLGLLMLANVRAGERATAAESAEAQLAALNRRLEMQVTERTADLETLQASVAHDLRNALHVVSLDLEQLIATQGGHESESPTSRLSRSVQRMGAIVDRLVGLSRASHATFERSTVDMTSLAREVVAELAEAQKVRPECRVDELPAAEADATLVRVLLQNLVDNALKYTRGQPSPRIEVTAESRRGEVVYTVRDNGRGFDAREAEHLFQPFTRLNGDGEPINGLGLGLTIARRVVSRHGGRIWAESTPGEGTRFHFTLEPASTG